MISYGFPLVSHYKRPIISAQIRRLATEPGGGDHEIAEWEAHGGLRSAARREELFGRRSPHGQMGERWLNGINLIKLWYGQYEVTKIIFGIRNFSMIKWD